MFQIYLLIISVSTSDTNNADFGNYNIYIYSSNYAIRKKNLENLSNIILLDYKIQQQHEMNCRSRTKITNFYSSHIKKKTIKKKSLYNAKTSQRKLLYFLKKKRLFDVTQPCTRQEINLKECSKQFHTK